MLSEINMRLKYGHKNDFSGVPMTGVKGMDQTKEISQGQQWERKQQGAEVSTVTGFERCFCVGEHCEVSGQCKQKNNKEYKAL